MFVSLSLLGSARLEGGDAAEELQPTKLSALLVYLAYAGRWVSRDELQGVLRGEDDLRASRGSLRLLLTRARRLPWAQGLEAEAQRLRWLVGTDTAQFQARVAAQDWRGAVQIYRAPLLQGWPPEGWPGFQEWLVAERSTLHALWWDAVVRYEDVLVGRGALDEAVQLLSRALAFEPLSEPVLQRYLHSAQLAGRRQEALGTFEAFATRLKAEMGLTPLPATLEIVEDLRRDEPPARPDAPALPRGHLPALEEVRPPRLVGRVDALSALRNASSPLVLVSGEPGVGKSRLLAEVFSGVRQVRCHEGLQNVPYLPLIEAVRAREQDLPDLGEYAPDLARLIPERQGEAPGPVVAETSAALGTEFEGKVRVFEALARVFAPEGVVVIDDLQWADPATLEWLVFMVGRGSVPIYGAFRNAEVTPALNGSLQAVAGQLTTIPLAPLSLSEVADLISMTIGTTGDGLNSASVGSQGLVLGGELAQELSAWLYPRSGGNPLVTLEWLRMLVQVGAYRVSRGHWQAQALALKQLEDLPMTPHLNDLVLRRAEHLSPEERRVLDLGSVLGGTLKVAHLAAVLGENQWQISDALARADRLGLLHGEQFAHDLVRQAILQDIPEAQRRFMHARVAATLEGTLDDLVVAEHAFQAGEETQAARLWLKTARESFGVQPGFEDEALRLYERIVALNLDIPEVSRAKGFLAVRLRVAGRVPEAKALIESVLRFSDDLESRIFALSEQTTMAYLDGDLETANQAIELAVSQVRTLDNPVLARSVKLMYVGNLHRQGRYEQALVIAQQMVQELRGERLTNRLLNWLGTLGVLLCDLGRFKEALPLYEEQLELAQVLNMPSEVVKASSDIIATLYDLGRIQEGLAQAEYALTLGEFIDSYPLRYHVALAHTKAGRLTEALEHALIVVRGSPSVSTRAHTYALLAEIHALAGRDGEAQATLNDGLTEVEPTSLIPPRAVMVIAALQFGSEQVIKRATPILNTLSEDNLPAYLLKDFRQAVQGRIQGHNDITSVT